MLEVLFDVTRLLLRGGTGAPTGIDRVTLAYGRWLRSRDDIRLTPVWSLGGRPATLAEHCLDTLLRVSPSESVARDDWPRLAAALTAPPTSGTQTLRTRPSGWPPLGNAGDYLGGCLRALAGWRPKPQPKGAVYLNVSHFGLEQPGLLPRLTARGARCVVMIHDLIPITHPEFCGPGAAGWHRRRLEATLAHADLVITNSETTAEDLRRFAEAEGLRLPSLCVSPLGLEPEFLRPPDGVLKARPYFVVVGTIEPRKNLTFLLTLWRRLAEHLGEYCPTLVLVGRRGWENESVIDHLQRSPQVRRWVHEVGNLNDENLARLIAGAHALLAPSFTEGFDLPAAEARALGTPVIASDIPVHRELALGAQLIDPLDGRAWLAALVAAAAQPPSPSIGPRFTWPVHFDRVARALNLEPDERPEQRRGNPQS